MANHDDPGAVQDALQDQILIVASADAFEVFCALLDMPPQPNARLVRALSGSARGEQARSQPERG